MNVAIQRATNDDLPELLELGAEYAAADGHTFDAATAERGFAGLLDDDRHGVVWVLTVDGRADGYAVVTWGWSIEIGGLDVVLDELYIRTQRRGLGGLLLEHLEADCRERGVRRIFLETERPNTGARRLYERHGYTADDSIWMAKELL